MLVILSNSNTTRSGHVDSGMTLTCLLYVIIEIQIQFEAVVRPRPELEVTRLDVVWKIENVYGTGGAKNGRRHPHDVTVPRHDSHGVSMFFESSVGTACVTQMTQCCLSIYRGIITFTPGSAIGDSSTTS